MSFLPLIILASLVILAVVFGLYVLFHKKKRLSSADESWVQKHWKEVLSLQQSNPQQAVLQGDKLVDQTLHKAGYRGSMADKLKSAKAIFRDENALWSAHKLRNRIAHEVGIRIDAKQVSFALKSFRKALEDLGISL